MTSELHPWLAGLLPETDMPPQATAVLALAGGVSPGRRGCSFVLAAMLMRAAARRGAPSSLTDSSRSMDEEPLLVTR